MNTEIVEGEYLGSITFLNMTGDISLAFGESNREAMLKLIRKKMKEGYTFFTVKTYPFKKLTRKVKVTSKNIDNINEIIITDEQFNKMVSDMDDKDIATVVIDNKVNLVKRQGKSEFTTLKRANDAEDVIDKNSIAIRPIYGG